MKNTVKIISLLLVVAMMLPMLASCIYDASEPTEPPPEQPTEAPTEGKGEPVDVNTSGSADGKTYVNRYFDLSLQLPAHWYFESDSNIESSPLTCFSSRTAQQKGRAASRWNVAL